MKQILKIVGKIVISFVVGVFLYALSGGILWYQSRGNAGSNTITWPFPVGLLYANLIFWAIVAYILIEFLSWVGRRFEKPFLAVIGKIVLSILFGLFLFMVTVRLGTHSVLPPCVPGQLCSMLVLNAPGGFPLSVWGGWSSGNFYSVTSIVIDIVFWIVLSYIVIEFVSRKVKLD